MAERLYCVNVSPVPRFAVIGRFESFISPESLTRSQPAKTDQHNMTLGKKKKKGISPVRCAVRSAFIRLQNIKY